MKNTKGEKTPGPRTHLPGDARAVAVVGPLGTSMHGFPPAEQWGPLPLVDAFGQYRHAEWRGKIHSEQALRTRRRAEVRRLSLDAGPADWTVYGGWQTGPSLEATGHFRTERHAGQWWLVDPLGKRFFSHGVDGVGMAETTPLPDREHWFTALPPEDGPFSCCYEECQPIHGYYAGRRVRAFHVGRANLIRKHGADWRARSAALCHARLRRWGLNTLGAWSDPDVCALRQTPYTVFVASGAARMIQGSQGVWGKFPDVFDPSFERAVRDSLSAKAALLRDPWCLGCFIDNELSWGWEHELAVCVLQSPAGQAAKVAFRDDLRTRYGSVEEFNRAWGGAFPDWDAFLSDRPAPEKAQTFADIVLQLEHMPPRRREDLSAFSRRIIERYFAVCRQALKEAAPSCLYLGCRFANVAAGHATAASIAARFCDVVSYNIYDYTLDEIALPDAADTPILIGEFHFGALDRGLLHTGLRQVADQRARGQAYARYVRGALRHPRCVGCHWFQYQDQPTTGRAINGENYQIGLVDIVDTPYAETIRQVRTVGRELYRGERRASG